MEKIVISLLSALLLMAGVQAQTTTNATVEKATVYLYGATLTQTATATLKSGSQEVTITGLSPFIETSSLKVTANGTVLCDGPILLTSIANGSYCGGGVKSNPYASVQDGKIDLSVINDLGRRNIPYRWQTSTPIWNCTRRRQTHY